MTFIDRLNEKPELMKAMLGMPKRANKHMAEQRRKENFSFLWDEGSMSKKEAIELIKEREQQFIEEYQEYGLPEWMLRCEAQDVLLEAMHSRMKEEDVI